MRFNYKSLLEAVVEKKQPAEAILAEYNKRLESDALRIRIELTRAAKSAQRELHMAAAATLLQIAEELGGTAEKVKKDKAVTHKTKAHEAILKVSILTSVPEMLANLVRGYCQKVGTLVSEGHYGMDLDDAKECVEKMNGNGVTLTIIKSLIK